MIKRVIRSAELDGYDPNDINEQYDTEVAECLADATIITSEVENPFEATTMEVLNGLFTDKHAPVLDIDFPAALIPSSTPGHYHLYLDKVISEDKYFALLDALADAGILQEGYVAASKSRGFTAVRLPWVEK